MFPKILPLLSLPQNPMRIFSALVLIVALVALAFVLNNLRQLRYVKNSFGETKNELAEVKSKFAAHQASQWPKFYDVNGKLLFKPGGDRLIIYHEEIPGVMPAMPMSYKVENLEQIKDLEAGDKVHFKLKETADKLFIIDIEKAK